MLIGFLDIFKRNSELEFMYDFDLLDETSERIKMKQIAIQTCVSMIARTISQSEFRVKKDRKTIKDELYYRLNVRPNKNMSSAHFWQTVIYKLIHDNECLIIISDTNDFLIADDFTRIEYGLVEDTFKGVTVKGYTFKRTFRMSDVVYIEYDNEKISRIIEELYEDYGSLFGRIFDFQMHKNQIRATVDMENVNAKDRDTQSKLQNFINNMYKAIKEKAFSIIPQQKGFEYKENSSTSQNSGIDEINKTSDAYLYQVAGALGIPIALLKGEMSDVEKQTRNYMRFCIEPILVKIKDELNAKFIEKEELLDGKKFDIRRPTYNNMFDVANAVDKLRASGVVNGHELRDELGFEEVDEPSLDEYYITKNYERAGQSFEGGDED